MKLRVVATMALLGAGVVSAVACSGPGGGGGAKALTLSASALDFGTSNCGGSAAAAQTITLTNPGGVTAEVTASVEGSPEFVIDGATAKVTFTLAAGASKNLALSPKPISAQAKAGVALTGSLSVTTKDGLTASTVALQVVPRGVTLLVTPSAAAGVNYDFGGVLYIPGAASQVTAASMGLTLSNLGNMDATVTLSKPADPQFDVDAPTLTVPAGSGGAAGPEVAVNATYSPAKFMPSSSSITLSVPAGTPVCGTSATGLTLKGRGSGTGANATAGALVWTPNCGAAMGDSSLTPKAVTVTNDGPTPFVFTAKLQTGSAFALSTPIDGGYVAGATPTQRGQSVFLVRPQPIPVSPDDVGPAPQNDLLTITSNDGRTIAIFPLEATPRGAVLAFSSLPSALTGTHAAPGSTPITIVNTGTLAASPSLNINVPSGGLTPQPFTLSSPLPTPISAGGAKSTTVLFTPNGGDASSYVGTLGISPGVGDLMCNTPPAVPLSGSGQTGSFNLLTSSAIGFGSSGFVTCGGPAASPVTVTFFNGGVKDFNWIAFLGNSNFSLSSTDGGALCPDSKNCAGTALASTDGGVPPAYSLVVTPAKLPFPASTAPNAYGDALTFNTDVPDDTAHVIPLNQTAQGVVLTMSPQSGVSPLDFGVIPLSQEQASNFVLVNSGNIPATSVVVGSTKSTGAGEFANSLGPTPYTVPAGGFRTVIGTFTAPIGLDPGTPWALSTGQYTITDTVDALCAPLPAAMPAQATITTGTALASPTTLVFTGPGTSLDAGDTDLYPGGGLSAPTVPGTTWCNTRAEPQQVTFINTGNPAFKLVSAKLASTDAGSSRCYSVVIDNPDAGIIGSETGTVTVIPAKVSTVLGDPAMACLNDRLIVRTTNSITPPSVFPITQRMVGASLSNLQPPGDGGSITIDFGDVSQGFQGVRNMAVSNVGNYDAVVRVVGPSGSTPFSFDANVAKTVLKNSTLQGNSTVPFNAYFNAPSTLNTYTDLASFTVVPRTTPLCQAYSLVNSPFPIPTPINLRGVSVKASSVDAGTTQTVSKTYTVVCTADVGFATLPVTQSFTVSLSGPTKAQSGTAFQIQVPASSRTLPTSAAGFGVTDYSQLSTQITIHNASFIGTASATGTTKINGTNVANVTGDVTPGAFAVNIPGPIPPGTLSSPTWLVNVQPPASGSGTITFTPSFIKSTAAVGAPLYASANVTCPLPTSPALMTIAYGP